MNEQKSLSYILITPARNEEAFIEKTIQSVISQTILPSRWVIVSDGSVDRTDEIAMSYLERHRWIEFLRMPAHEDRQFAAKVHSFQAGYRRIKDLEFDIVGNLDADLTFEPDYFEYLLCQFARDPNLGAAGTPFVEDLSTQYNYRYTNIEHVSGACQLFRRACFDSIGGYRPVKEGGIDWIAVTMARMKGWKTRTFTDKVLFHHRKMGTGKNSLLGARYSLGQQDYYLGNHPLWEILRTLYQLRRRPYFWGGLFLFLGYFSAALKTKKRSVPPELVAFIRHEQMGRLRKKIPLTRKCRART